MNEKGYAPAIEKALEQLQGINFERQCGLCGADYNGKDSSAVIPFFGRPYRITMPDGNVQGPEGPATVVVKLILLHHIARSDGIKPYGKMITFREIPEGTFYFPSFHDRVLKPFLESFGNAPELLREKGHALDWSEAGLGDISFQTNAFPLVPIRFILWLGDEELAPEAGMLFDSTISHHLHTEDIALLAEQALGILVAT